MNIIRQDTLKKSFIILCTIACMIAPPSEVSAQDISLFPAEEEMLDQIQKYTLDFFLRERDRNSGLVRDRAHNFQT